VQANLASSTEQREEKVRWLEKKRQGQAIGYRSISTRWRAITMQTELEKWIEKHQYHDFGVGHVVEVADLRALLAGKVLCAQQSIAAISTSSGEVVATLDAAYFGTNWTPLYAPADIGTMRIVAIQGAAEEYARQGNTVLANELRDKFGKEQDDE
jgi:hypothetical protein